MRTPPAIVLTLVTALALSSCAQAGSAPPPGAPSAEPASPVEAPETAEKPEEAGAPEETEEPDKPEEDHEEVDEAADAPQNVDDLPDIWPEVSALWARQPSESRDNHCSNLEDEATTEATVMMWQLLYSDATDEEADAEDVEVVLRWLCSDNA